MPAGDLGSSEAGTFQEGGSVHYYEFIIIIKMNEFIIIIIILNEFIIMNSNCAAKNPCFLGMVTFVQGSVLSG